MVSIAHVIGITPRVTPLAGPKDHGAFDLLRIIFLVHIKRTLGHLTVFARNDKGAVQLKHVKLPGKPEVSGVRSSDGPRIPTVESTATPRHLFITVSRDIVKHGPQGQVRAENAMEFQDFLRCLDWVCQSKLLDLHLLLHGSLCIGTIPNGAEKQGNRCDPAYSEHLIVRVKRIVVVKTDRIFDMRLNKRTAVYFCAHVHSTIIDWWRVARPVQSTRHS